MKLYIDLSCDKISGQQMMQRALRKYVQEHGLWAEKEDANVLVYVQVPFDSNIVDEWKLLKAQGKRIVFIHHYMSESFYNRCAIFKIEGLFELIDKHICITRYCELYNYLRFRGVQEEDIFTIELAAADYDKIYQSYFAPTYMKENSICFVGKMIKGLDKFVEFSKSKKFKNRFVLCPDLNYELPKNFTVYTDKQYNEVYEIMSRCKFIYCPTVYNVPKFHLETCLQEAIPCGCIPIVDRDSFSKILDTKYLAKYGFVSENFFNLVDDRIHSQLQSRAIEFQKSKYLTLEKTLEVLTRYLQMQ